MADVTQNLYRCTPRQISGFIEECFYAGLVPFVRSSPGMGKSTIFRKLAKKLGLKPIDHRLSTSDPTDLSGLPHFVNGFARFAPFEELFPVESSPLPTGYNGWMVFLDEFNAASKAVQAASYKLILDKMVGQLKLHPRVVLGMAGNLDTDRAITNTISTAMQSRVIHLEMMIDFPEWLEDVALTEDYDSRIISFLRYEQDYLMDFRPDHNEKTFCCPRTWEFMNRLIKGNDVKDTQLPLYAGTITSGVAAKFITHAQIHQHLITMREILSDPAGCVIPSETPMRWAVVCHMMGQVTDKNYGDLCTYASRFPLDFKILFFRSTMVRHAHLRTHPSFAKAMIELSRYLNG